jgi:minor histocompatibility antigen H13
MSDNSSALDSVSGGLDVLNATAAQNGTARDMSWIETLQDIDFLLLELKLVASAMGIIYLGAHAALRRPPSAASPKDKKSRRKTDDENRFAQGLELSDAIMFPLMAAVMLIGLYYLIQWLKDPAILSKILRWYMSIVSLASLVTLYAHGFDFVSGFAFPTYWRGLDGVLRKIEQKTETVLSCDDVGNVTEGSGASSRIANPLPGILGWLTPTTASRRAVWKIRGLLKREWLLKFFLQGAGEETAHIKFSTMMAIPLAAATAIFYFSTTSPMLSNMLGYGMCYCSFLMLSPTDLLTGSLVLCALFFYDIFMVFYTPYMVTVATTLDVPIKLQFKAGERQSILGLGDIVIPGLLIAWTLRADLWMHYLRRTKYESTDLKILEKDAASGQVVTRSETKHREVKAPYVEAKGNWGDRLWTRRRMFLCAAKQLPTELTASQFPKTYFYASMVGYLGGMLVTLAMLLVFKRGQPALLYLVPGVLGTTYLTAIVRGEMKSLWKYTEDGSLDTVDVVVDLDADGNAIKTIGTLENGVVDTTKKKDKEGEAEKKDGEKKVTENGAAKGAEAGSDDRKDEKTKKNHQVFFLSLEAPPEEEDE